MNSKKKTIAKNSRVGGSRTAGKLTGSKVASAVKSAGRKAVSSLKTASKSLLSGKGSMTKGSRTQRAA